MINNFEQIKGLLKFDDEYDFYFLQIIQRKKDHPEGHVLGSNNSNRLIKAYYIYSVEQLEKQKDEIIALCTLFNARAGISLNRRNSKTLSLEMLALLATNIKNEHFKPLSGLYNTVCGQHHSDKDKSWIIDIDWADYNVKDIGEIGRFINDIEPVGDKLLALINTKSGMHIITKPFNSKIFGDKYPNIEVHKNNPTVLYIS